jgi:hypothetical protein
MTYLSAFILLISYSIYALLRNRKVLLIVVVFFLVSFNLFWFFKDRDPNFKGPYIPTSFHYSEIRKNDIKLGSKINYIKSHYKPESTIVITSPDPWRPLMYYLKDYYVYDVDAIYTNDPRFEDILRIGDNWNRTQEITKKRELSFQSNIKNIIFTDDNANLLIKNADIKTVSLPGNSNITILRIDKGQKLYYSFHSISKV